MKIIIVLASIAVLLATAGYFFIVKPGIQFVNTMNEMKPEVLERAAAFVNCISDERSLNCKEQFMTENAQKVSNDEGLRLLGMKIRNKLGKRLVVSIDDKSYRANKNFNSNGTTMTFSFTAKVKYDKDPAVTETYILVKKGTAPFLVHSFNINSNELLR